MKATLVASLCCQAPEAHAGGKNVYQAYTSDPVVGTMHGNRLEELEARPIQRTARPAPDAHPYSHCETKADHKCDRTGTVI